MPAAVPGPWALTLLLVWGTPSVFAAGLDATSDELPIVSAGDLTPGISPNRAAALRSTLEKRKAKRARSRVAYQRTSAEANAMIATAVATAARQAAFFSQAPTYALQGASQSSLTGVNSSAFYQVSGAAGTTGLVSAGGTGGCQRR